MFARKGFTLSEVMVTMVVLGVLGAILIPVVMNVAPSKNKILMKKAHSTLEKAVSEMISDDTNYPYSQTGTDSNGATVSRGFNYTTATTNGAADKFCYFLSQSLDIVGTQPTCASADTSVFTTADGIQWTIFPYPTTFTLSSTEYYTKIIVDINGPGSNGKPNCTVDAGYSTYSLTQCIGTTVPDQFIMGIRYDGKIQISSGNNSDSVIYNILANPSDNSK